MREIISTITRKGQVTIPAEVRRHLGVGTPDTVAFVIEGEEVRLKPMAFTLASVRGSIAPLPGRETRDFEDQIAEAKEERAEQLVRRLRER